MPLRLLYPPADQEQCDDIKVDIIAVHGLNPRNKDDEEHAWDTWRKPRGTTGRLWLRDDLPECARESRIFLYKYESRAVFSQGRNTFIDKANDLLEELVIERKATPDRPLLLLGHSMGGLLVKQALINAHSNPRYARIKEATVGLAFFATPHFGGNDALVKLGTATAGIAKLLGFQEDTSIMETLGEGSIFQDIMGELWRHQLPCYQIRSFWGTRDKIVAKDSARFGMSGEHENIVSLEADHSDVCKFGPAQTDRDNYRKVAHNIEELYQLAVQKFGASNDALTIDHFYQSSTRTPTPSETRSSLYLLTAPGADRSTDVVHPRRSREVTPSDAGWLEDMKTRLRVLLKEAEAYLDSEAWREAKWHIDRADSLRISLKEKDARFHDPYAELNIALGRAKIGLGERPEKRSLKQAGNDASRALEIAKRLSDPDAVGNAWLTLIEIEHKYVSFTTGKKRKKRALQVVEDTRRLIKYLERQEQQCPAEWAVKSVQEHLQTARRWYEILQRELQ